MPTDAGGLTGRSNNRPASPLYMTMSTVEQRTVGPGRKGATCRVDINLSVRYISEVLKYQSVDFGRDTSTDCLSPAGESACFRAVESPGRTQDELKHGWFL